MIVPGPKDCISQLGFDEEEALFDNEEELGELLWQLIRQARKQKLNPELALRREMLNRERVFRNWEKEHH